MAPWFRSTFVQHLNHLARGLDECPGGHSVLSFSSIHPIVRKYPRRMKISKLYSYFADFKVATISQTIPDIRMAGRTLAYSETHFR
jgi:hypothetical protein